jgi:hypothetical protein
MKIALYFVYVGSRTHRLAAAGCTQPSSKARCSGKTYKFVSGLRCNGHFPFLVTHLNFVPVTTCKRSRTEIVGSVFSKIYLLHRFKNWENSYGQRNQLSIVCTCTTNSGNKVCKMGSAFFFSCHSSLSRWQEYKAIYVKVRAHYLLSS